jgi:protein gp37
MADKTHIEWTDATWNPITGCSVVSAGCRHCYAMKLAGTRLQHHPSRDGLTIATKEGPVWTGETRYNAEWLDQPIRWRRPRKVFVCAHGDLFHESVPDEWIDRVFAVMTLAPQHTFQVLTKRAKRMRDYMTAGGRFSDVLEIVRNSELGYWAGAEKLAPQSWPLPHVWLGVSVEDQAAADTRIPVLLETPAWTRWVSAEPLLAPVEISGYLDGMVVHADISRPNVDWVVAGGESGANARPMHPEWVRSLRHQCVEACVPFLFKQWGEWCPSPFLPKGTTLPAHRWGWISEKGGPAEINHYGPFKDEFAHHELMGRVGKRAAGRLLDGIEYNGYPMAP